MFPQPRVQPSLLLTLLVILSALPALATETRTEAVYVANSANNHILRIDFDRRTSTVINTDANVLRKPSALLVRNDGGGVVSLVVCDSGADQVRFYADVASPSFDGRGTPVTGLIHAPDGVSSDSSGNLYLVSSTANSVGQLWTIPKGAGTGGYGTAIPVDPAVPSDLLEDTRVVKTTSGSLEAGDVLVLSRKPATLFRYRGVTCTGGSCSYASRSEFIPEAGFPPGVEPSGLDFAPDGKLLISTLGGDILRYDGTGQQASPDFYRGLGVGPFKLVVGFQNGQNRAFVTQRNNHAVFAFDILVDGTGSLAPGSSVTDGLSFPQGVGLANASAGAFIPVTTGQVTAAFATHTSTFSNVKTAGLTDVTCRLLPPDPRESESPTTCVGEGGTWEDGFCKRSLLLNELDPNLRPVEIPANVRAFPIGDPHYGSDPQTRKFFFCEGKTTARFQFAAVTEEESEFLQWGGEEPTCDDPDTSKRAMFFWSPIPESVEPPIHEGTKFINLSTGCGHSNRGDIDDYSYFIPAARDTDPLPTVAGRMLVGVEGAIDQLADQIDGTVEGALRLKRDEAETAFELFTTFGCQAYKDQVLAALGPDVHDLPPPDPSSFRGIILSPSNSSAFDDSARNVSGELLVRANSAGWIVSNIPAASDLPKCCTQGKNAPTCRIRR